MSRPPRVDGFSYTGLYRYFLTCCTFERRNTFRDVEAVELALSKFRQSAEHDLHVLAEGTHHAADFRRFVKRAKQHSGAAYALQCGGRLWQEGYFDRVLRNSENTEQIVRYILANPVRAGLVFSPHEYPFLGSERFGLDDLFDHCQNAGSKRTRPTD